MLGRLFEPYVVHLLPNLLLCFGDNSQYIRQVCYSSLSAFDVRLKIDLLCNQCWVYWREMVDDNVSEVIA